MKKLHDKIFGVIFVSLSVCLFCFIFIFNLQNYYEQQNFIENHLRTAPTALEHLNQNQNQTQPQTQTQQPQSEPKNRSSDSTAATDYIQTLVDRANQITTTLLAFSTLLFIALEIVIFFVSRAIANWAIKPAKETFDKQKQFIADTSHELKTPLSVIIASSEALEKEPENQKWLTNIKSESNRMNLLITELLELASSEHLETLPLKSKNLSNIVELTTLTFEGKAFEKNLKLKARITPNLTIPLSENSVKQLIEILLDNAIDHAKPRSTIHLTLVSDQKHIILTIKNQGKPIPKGEEEKIFDRFYRVDKSRSRKNNHYGLGLAIAKNIAEAHGATISAASTKTSTVFTVIFKK